MPRLRTFFLGIGLAFGLPWLFLIVAPSFYLAGLEPIAFGEDEETQGFYPTNTVSVNGQGIYKAEGCVNCHTQMIRPDGAGIDVWRKGWGQDQEEFNQPLRPSGIRDYQGESYALLGGLRGGPDLSSVGYRRADRDWHFLHLYAPRAINPWSNMPSFKHLFDKREIVGGGAGDALDLPEAFAPEAGYEIVPTAKARALVDYLMSLRKDSPIPADGGVAAASTASE